MATRKGRPTKAMTDERARVAYELATVDGLRQVDIAGRLGVSQQSVSALVRRGQELARAERQVDQDQERARVERVEQLIGTLELVRQDAVSVIRARGEERAAAWREARAAVTAQAALLDSLYAPAPASLNVDVDARSVNVVTPDGHPVIVAALKKIAEGKKE